MCIHKTWYFVEGILQCSWQFHFICRLWASCSHIYIVIKKLYSWYWPTGGEVLQLGSVHASQTLCCEVISGLTAPCYNRGRGGVGEEAWHALTFYVNSNVSEMLVTTCLESPLAGSGVITIGLLRSWPDIPTSLLTLSTTPLKLLCSTFAIILLML